MQDIFRDRIEKILYYHPYVLPTDIEKIYQRQDNQGLFLFEIDNRIIDNLELINQHRDDILKMNQIQNQELPNYFDNKHNIVFLPVNATAKNIVDQSISPNRIVNESALVNIFQNVPDINQNNIIHYIRYRYLVIIQCLDIYAKLYPTEIDILINSGDLLDFIESKLKTDLEFYHKVRNLIQENLPARLAGIIKQYHSILYKSNGIKNKLCRIQYNSVAELSNDTSNKYITERKNKLTQLINTADQSVGSDILVKHLKLKELGANNVDCSDTKFSWSKSDFFVDSKKNCEAISPEMMMLDYMPEFAFAKTTEEKFLHRQTVLGTLDEIKLFSNCTKDFISDVFLPGKYDIDHVSWSPELNKVFMNCIGRRDLIFPIRYYAPNFTEIGRYKSFPTAGGFLTNHSDLIFCGSLIVPLVGHCKYRKFNSAVFNYYGDELSIHTYFIYFDTTNRLFSVYNYRANLVGVLYADTVSENYFMDEIRVAYIELNILHYYRPKLYLYQYLNTNIYFFSKYTEEEIKKKYEKYNTNPSDINRIIANLKKTELIKDSNTKLFYTTESHGKNKVLLGKINELKQKLEFVLEEKKISKIKSINRPKSRVLGYESDRDWYKMGYRRDTRYIREAYPITKEHLDYVNKNFPNDTKIRFVLYEDHMSDFDSYQNIALISKNTDLKLRKKLEFIVEAYIQTLKSGMTLEEIRKKNYESTIKELDQTEIKNFLSNRQVELNQNKDFYKKLHLEKLKRDRPKNGTCDKDFVWSDIDVLETATNQTCPKFDDSIYPYLKQYYPERLVAYYPAIKNKILFTLRPTILGFLSEQEKYDNCQKYFRTKFTIDPEKANLKYFNWSFDLNRVFIRCILDNSELIFPILLVDPDFINGGRYSTFDPDKAYTYVGIMSVPFTDLRIQKHPTERFIYYVFKEYDKNDPSNYNLVLFNHRQNKVTPGMFFDQYRITYVELNQIYFYKPTIYVYLYAPSKKFQKKLYLFSKLSKDMIKKKYQTTYASLYSPEEIDMLINELIPVEFKKDPETKLFTFDERSYQPQYKFKFRDQTGGKILFKTGHSRRLQNQTSPKLDIQISSNQAYFDPDIYPANKFNKYIEKFNKVKSKFKSYGDYVEAVGIVYKYHCLKKQFVLSNIIDPAIYDYVYNKRYKPISQHSNKKILLYDFFYSETLTLLEYFVNFNLFDKKADILLVTKTGGYLEAVCFYMQKYLSGNKFDKIHTYIPAYTVGTKFNFDMIRGVIDLYHLKYNLLTEPLNNQTVQTITASNQKYDFILLDPHINDPELPYHRDQLNHTFLISQINLAVRCLKPTGNMLVCVPNISTKITAEIIYYLGSLFETKYIYHTETTQSSYQSYAIMYLNFKNISGSDLEQITKLTDQLYKLDPTGYSNYNILDTDIRKLYSINKKITKDTQREFLSSFAPYTDPSYNKTIKKFNMEYLGHFKQFIFDLNDYYENKTDAQYLDWVFNNSLLESINFAKKLDLEIKPGVLTDIQSDKFYTKLVYMMFSYENIIEFTFLKITDVHIKLDPHREKLSPMLKKLSIDYHLSAQIIDTRDPARYDYVKKYIRYYERTLGDKLNSKYKINIGGRRVSRAWIKFYEILHETPLLKSLGNSINSFHICEAPGTFIMCLESYIKKNIPNGKINWVSQSLRDSSIFDDYGLIKSHPNQWDFGSDNTGDITNLANIRSYVKKYSGKNLVTADCGTSWDERDLTSKLKYCMIVLMLGVLGLGGNFVFKTLMPINESIIISLYYILFAKFEKLIFFKPLQNAWSPEFYVIGINYKNKLNDSEYEILLKQIEQYDRKICLVQTDKSYSRFVLQLENITNKLKNNFRLAILRNIFFVDNWDKLSNEDKENIKINIEEKNDEWINRFLLNSI